MDVARTIRRTLGSTALLLTFLTAQPGLAQQVADTTLPKPPGAVVVDTSQDQLSRMTVPVFINGQGPFPFAVDTGAERTVISAALAQRLGLVANRTAELHSVTGVDIVKTAQIATLRIGSREVSNIQAPVLPDGNIGAEGLLGIDAISDQRVVMNFVDKEMSVIPGAVRQPEDRESIVVTAKRKYGQLVLVDASIDGQRVYAIIDSGSQVTVANEAMRRLLTKRQRAKETATEIIGVTGRSMSANYAMLPQMKIGSMRLGDIPIVYSDAHPFKKFGLVNKPAMLIGTDLLRAFERVSLDFNTKKVRFLLRSEESRMTDTRLAALE
jgi:predicted aspartyl protease